MRNLPTANQLSGRAIGATFFTGFGALWITLSLYAREHVTVFSVSTVILGLLMLLLIVLWLFREAKRFPRVPEDPAQSRAFRRINIFQWVAVAVAAFALGRLHLDAYIPSAVTAIVGLHLFPLAKLFRFPMHHATAIALVLWATICLLVVPVGSLQGITALGTGVILWISAATSLAAGLVTARRVDGSVSRSQRSVIA